MQTASTRTVRHLLALFNTLAMEDDLIVVDDVEDHAGPSTAGPSSVNGDSFYAPSPSTRTRPLRSAAEHAMATNFRRREGSTPPLTGDGRATRSSTLRQRPQPKLKLKLSDKAAAQAPGMSFLGAYDRELDSDDEDLAFEEQFVLRMPPGEDCEKLRKMVHTREVENDVWFKFKGSFRAVAVRIWLISVNRFTKSSISYRQLFILFKTSRLAMYHRVAQDSRQQTNVQSRRHMPSTSISQYSTGNYLKWAILDASRRQENRKRRIYRP